MGTKSVSFVNTITDMNLLFDLPNDDSNDVQFVIDEEKIMELCGLWTLGEASNSKNFSWRKSTTIKLARYPKRDKLKQRQYCQVPV